ncbi:MAG TPA: hypothetical protein VH087_11955 [Thermoanaerobaculia bacterium]|jgi:hypothetical protein|nr:hypothetical protein [Thermoanaerobaculia bacterium]
MDTQGTNTPTPAGTDPAAPDLTAEELIAQVRALRARIPDFTQLSTAEMRSRVPVANLHPDFVVGSIQITGASGKLQQATGQDPAVLLRDASDDVEWSVAEEELRGLLRGVSSMNLSRRHRLGKAALVAYSLGRQLVRLPENADLIPHVEKLQRLRRLGRRKPADPQPETPATPQTTTPPKQS